MGEFLKCTGGNKKTIYPSGQPFNEWDNGDGKWKRKSSVWKGKDEKRELPETGTGEKEGVVKWIYKRSIKFG